MLITMRGSYGHDQVGINDRRAVSQNPADRAVVAFSSRPINFYLSVTRTAGRFPDSASASSRARVAASRHGGSQLFEQA